MQVFVKPKKAEGVFCFHSLLATVYDPGLFARGKNGLKGLKNVFQFCILHNKD